MKARCDWESLRAFTFNFSIVLVTASDFKLAVAVAVEVVKWLKREVEEKEENLKRLRSFV